MAEVKTQRWGTPSINDRQRLLHPRKQLRHKQVSCFKRLTFTESSQAEEEGGRFTQPPQLENLECQQQPLKAQDLSEVSY